MDVSDPSYLATLFKANPKTLSENERQFLNVTRWKTSKHSSGVEWTDFTCNETKYGVGDGNTICDNRFVRRGLPQLSNTLKVPQNKTIELVKFTKTNGDCCMFSYLPQEDLFLVATRNISVMVKDADELSKIESKN